MQTYASTNLGNSRVVGVSAGTVVSVVRKLLERGSAHEGSLWWCSWSRSVLDKKCPGEDHQRGHEQKDIGWRGVEDMVGREVFAAESARRLRHLYDEAHVQGVVCALAARPRASGREPTNRQHITQQARPG